MKSKEEVKNKVCMHWNSGFCKQSQCYHVHTDEDCDNRLQGEKCRYSKCRDVQGQTRTDRDRQGQAGTDREKQGQAGTGRECPCLSLFVPVCPCLSLPCLCLSLLCPCLSLLVPVLSLALTGIIGKQPFSTLVTPVAVLGLSNLHLCEENKFYEYQLRQF